MKKEKNLQCVQCVQCDSKNIIIQEIEVDGWIEDDVVCKDCGTHMIWGGGDKYILHLINQERWFDLFEQALEFPSLSIDIETYSSVNLQKSGSRDILCFAMKGLRNCSIVGHVHDEIIIEADQRMTVDTICEQMSKTPPWVRGLLLRADGFECPFYKKD